MKLAPLLLAAFLPFSAGAEVICALGPDAASYKSGADQRPSSDALLLAGRVNAAVKTICSDHCPTMGLFRNATAPNIMLIADSGQAKLVYSPQFLAMVYDSFGDNGIMALIAHELGHALDATLGATWIKSSWTPEQRADAWAGCVLARMNSGTRAFDVLQKYPRPSATAWSLRLTALRAGYMQCHSER